MTSLSFTINNTTFHLTPVAHRYEWRTVDGTCRCGGNPGRKTYWANFQGLTLGREYPSLTRAMRSAVNFRELWGVRRCEIPDALRGPSSSESGLVFERMAA